MSAPRNLGLCHFDQNTAVRLLPQEVRTAQEEELGVTEHVPVCRSCARRFTVLR